MKERETRQLAAILGVVVQARDHPTADEVFRRVQNQMPQVSLGTVYRNLHKLVAQGRVLRVDLPSHVARYDGMTAAHDHFLCEDCGGVADLLPDDKVQLAGLCSKGYQVRTHSLTVFGSCPRCGSKAPRPAHRAGAGQQDRRAQG